MRVRYLVVSVFIMGIFLPLGLSYIFFLDHTLLEMFRSAAQTFFSESLSSFLPAFFPSFLSLFSFLLIFASIYDQSHFLLMHSLFFKIC